MNDYVDTAPTTPGGAIAGGIFFPILILALYIYTAYALYKIAEKTNTPNAWFAFVPILNIALMIQIARQSLWWLLALLVPLVNVIVIIWLWMKVAEARNRPSWWGILMIIGPINLIVLYFLAFKDADTSVVQASASTPAPAAPTPPPSSPTPPSAS